jgi:hypothetical protein
MFTPHPPQGGAGKETDFKVPLGGFRGKEPQEDDTCLKILQEILKMALIL